MGEEYYINNFCTVRNRKVYKNGTLIYENHSSGTVKEFAREVYKSQGLHYPKFYKMDELCKLSFLASEVLLQDYEHVPEDTALVLSNRASSLDTDKKHQETIQDRNHYFPSPTLFVYTLPNIMMGEISIRYQLKSENAFFVSDQFDANLMTQYSKILLDTQKASHVICGWVDLDTHKYDVFLALFSKKGKYLLTKEQLNNFYNTQL